jgi:hypothetical protein
MLAPLLLALALAQDPNAALLERLLPVVERASDLDPHVRAEAPAEAARIVEAQEAALTALAKQQRIPAMIVLALAGKLEPAALLRFSDRAARRVACDLLTPTKAQLPDVLRLLDAKDPGTRVAACLALGRVEDGALHATISSALGHGMRRTGNADQLFTLVLAGWRGGVGPQQFFTSDVDADRAGLAVVALCNVPGLVVTDSYAPALLRTLEFEKLDRPTRSLLLRVLGRRSPSTLLPALSIRDAKFRAEIVDVVDRRLADPLSAPALFEAWREAKAKKTDDGKVPAQPLTVWIESWIRRLCGDAVTPETFPAWVRSTFKVVVDRRADAAVRRGAAALQGLLARENAVRNSPGGYSAVSSLAAYALLKSGVPAEDPGVARCLDVLLERDPEGIYGTSLAAMALATAIEKGAPRKERLDRRLQRNAEILVASQMKSGGWSYAARIYPDQTTSGWTYDLSNTQFAVLGLRAAANAGAKVPKTTWERALALLEKTQGEDGGWCYHGREHESAAAMTAAGAYSWLICKLSLDDGFAPREAGGNTRVRETIRLLDRVLDQASHWGRPDYYLLYSVERLCMISQLETLGGRDWYADGATILLRAQGQDGLWSGYYSSVVDTSLALLFLRKAFVARPDIATESAAPRATPERAQDVFERRSEALFIDGVRDLRVGRDAATSFILVIVDSEPAATAVSIALGREVDGVPLRVEVE